MGDYVIGRYLVSRGPMTRTDSGWVAYLEVYAASDTIKNTILHTATIAFDGTAIGFTAEFKRKASKLYDAGKIAVETIVDGALDAISKE